MGAAQAKVVTFVADGPTVGSGSGSDRIVTQVKLVMPFRVGRGARLVSCRAPFECGIGGLASDQRPPEGALPAASETSHTRRPPGTYYRRIVMGTVEGLAIQPVWPEIRYLTKHSDAGRLRYHCFRCRGVPMGSGVIEEHDPTGSQPSAEGQRHLLDGGECGGRVPTTGCRRFRWIGRTSLEHAPEEAIARDRRTEWLLDTTGMLGQVESMFDDEDEKIEAK